MASFMTNRGKARRQDGFFRNTNVPTTFFFMLFEATPAPTVDTNTVSELTEIPAGNGYPAGGEVVNRNNVDFDSLVEDDTLDQARLQLRDYVFTASGGPLPASGPGAAFGGLVDDNGTVGNREVIYMLMRPCRRKSLSRSSLC